MERLWTPWRLAYVTGSARGGNAGCVFCNEVAVDPNDAESIVIARGRSAYVILNRYPYNNGHLLIAPNRHVDSLSKLEADELVELMALTRDAEAVLTQAYQPHGINLGMNLGRPAGAGIADHLHMHVVPRWNGDTSFMSVVGNVRVLPEELGDTVRRLRPLFEQVLNRR